ncbi:PaeR7I family type II restriction endonuclease [Janthinobacterium tructae]|uniref:PaeR7I family type II restriction endonuclease n=1 Tax=Janthinobacterium tructae TaxID=2590869 RepID=UPI00249CEAE6|nr:PaeR7I family type II restriction endonuclease [Janthinobacterium tructae]MDI3295581.1 PaeR7I family type II restriction endonuclease [Janthinobacterium tructae]
MSLDLANYQQKSADAIKAFWESREKARQKQVEAGVIDQGERAGVTGGKNLDGFVSLILDLVNANGLSHAEIHQASSLVV